MNYKKHTKSYSIEDFTNQISEDLYCKFFTEKEIVSFGKKRKKGSMAARYLLKQLLIEHFNNDLKYTDVEVLNNEMGKPTLKIKNRNDVETKHVFFSLSHSKDTVVVFVIFENYEA